MTTYLVKVERFKDDGTTGWTIRIPGITLNRIHTFPLINSQGFIAIQKPGQVFEPDEVNWDGAGMN